jgi:hypothetical protein
VSTRAIDARRRPEKLTTVAPGEARAISVSTAPVRRPRAPSAAACPCARPAPLRPLVLRATVSSSGEGSYPGRAFGHFFHLLLLLFVCIFLFVINSKFYLLFAVNFICYLQ